MMVQIPSLDISIRRQQERGLMHKTRNLFSNVLDSLVFYYTCFRKANFCVQAMSEQYLDVCVAFSFVRGAACAEAKIWKKNS